VSEPKTPVKPLLVTHTTLVAAYEAAMDARVKSEQAAIDAAACGTSRDWDRSHDAQDAACEADETFRLMLRRAIK
jgi:hypothetical protein